MDGETGEGSHLGKLRRLQRSLIMALMNHISAKEKTVSFTKFTVELNHK